MSGKKEKVFEGLIRKFKSLDGVVVGKDLQPSKLRLAKDEKGAMVNDVVDKYMRKELTDKYLQRVKEEHMITSKDIIREITKREIEKVMGL
jgi:hypothetical protein